MTRAALLALALAGCADHPARARMLIYYQDRPAVTADYVTYMACENAASGLIEESTAKDGKPQLHAYCVIL